MPLRDVCHVRTFDLQITLRAEAQTKLAISGVRARDRGRKHPSLAESAGNGLSIVIYTHNPLPIAVAVIESVKVIVDITLPTSCPPPGLLPFNRA
jgi:hypothetical protein